jgi:7-keto-8-aminopelargonate synthetase-like enzyme
VQFSSSRAYMSCAPYREFEALLGEIFEAPLVVAPSTTLGHYSALPVLVGDHDAMLVDQLVHNSVQSVLPTLAAAGVTIQFVRHSRVDRLDDAVTTLSRQHPRVWYLGDGIYSMHGDAAPVAALQDLAARHERLHLYLDDAHGMSWAGRNGRGYVLGAERVPPRTVVALSLCKAFSGAGAALVFPDAESARRVRTCGSTMIFSGPLQPASLGAGIASARIHLSKEITFRQQKLMERIRLFNALAAERGVPLASTDETPIRFVRIGDNDATFAAAVHLMKQGFYFNTAVYPAVTRGQGGLRFALTVHQTLDDVRAVVEAVARLV